jgi:hypothetical protein
MRKISVVLVGLVLLSSSCKKKEEAPQYSGEIQLSSEILQSDEPHFYGFSFETGNISLYTLSDALADLTAIHLIFGENFSVDLYGSDEMEAFHKNGLFSTAAEAETFYTNYKEVLAQEFIFSATDIKENEIWTVQTGKKHFAKIWIKEVTWQTGSHSDFAIIRIQYEYQPDGSRTFD